METLNTTFSSSTTISSLALQPIVQKSMSCTPQAQELKCEESINTLRLRGGDNSEIYAKVGGCLGAFCGTFTACPFCGLFGTGGGAV
jgi:hypothetical protein